MPPVPPAPAERCPPRRPPPFSPFPPLAPLTTPPTRPDLARPPVGTRYLPPLPSGSTLEQQRHNKRRTRWITNNRSTSPRHPEEESVEQNEEMSGKRRDEAAPSVGVFWDYENIRFPADYPAHTAFAALRELGLSQGAAGGPRWCYMDTAQERGKRQEQLRADLQLAGWSVLDAAHDGRKDVVDKMVMVDMLVWALLEQTPPTVILITGDQDYYYACSTLRNHAVRVILITSATATVRLKESASEVMDWRLDILKLPAKQKKSGTKDKVKAKKNRYYDEPVAYGSRDPPPPPRASTSYSLAYPSFFQDDAADDNMAKKPRTRSSTAVDVPSAPFKRIPPALVSKDVPPPFSRQKSPSPYLPLEALAPLDLTGSNIPSAPVARKTSSKGKGKARQVEVIEISDDDDEDGKEDAEAGAELPKKASADEDTEDEIEYHPRGSATTAVPSRSPKSSPRRAPPTASYPSSRHPLSAEAPQPTSTMDESEDGAPAGRIDVLRSLGRGDASSSAGKKRKRVVELDKSASPPPPSSGGKKAKRRRPSPAVAIDDEEVDELDDNDGQVGAFDPKTPFSARSTASSHYDLLLTNPATSDVEESPLAGGSRRKGATSLAKAVLSRATAASRRAEVAGRGNDDDASGGEGDDSVVIVSD